MNHVSVVPQSPAFALVPEDPRVVLSAEALDVTPVFLVEHMKSSLTSATSHNLYLTMQVGTFHMTPRQFGQVMYVFLGREPNEHDLSEIADRHHKHVATSSATRLLDYFEGVLSVIEEAREAGIGISHLHAAWLVITYGDQATAKLDELYCEHGHSTQAMRASMRKGMRDTEHFARFV